MRAFRTALAGFIAIAAVCLQGQVTPPGPLMSPSNLGGLLYASNFGQWQVPKGNLGQYSWNNGSYCQPTVGSFSPAITINGFTVGTPVKIVDTDTPAHNETVTPTAVTIVPGGSGSCSINISPIYGHDHFYFTSATAGLQEALNWAGANAYEIVLGPDWTLLGGTTGTITAATGSTSVTILDQRTAALQTCTWGGSAYVCTAVGGNVNLAAGVVAGTGTGSANSIATPPQVSLSAGQSILQPSTATLQGCLRNAATQICPIAIADADSTWCCIGPTNIANGPAFQLQQYLKNQGYPIRGTGLYTLNANPGAPKAGWKALNPTLSGISQTSELGPSQTGEAAFGSVWVAATIGGVVQGFAISDIPNLDAAGVGFAGNQLIIEGLTDLSTTACTITVDATINFVSGTYTGGTVLTTSLGGTTSTPTAYYQTYNIPGSTSNTTHSALVTPTNLSAGQCDIYAIGYNQNSTGVEIDNFATGNARSEAFGTSPATQMAFVDAMPVAPVAAFVVIGINDMINGTGVTQSQYSANVQASITHLLAKNPQMSIIIVDEQNVTPSTPVLTKPQVQATEQALAIANNGQYLSTAQTWGTEANAAANGWMLDDGIHFTDTGGRNDSGMVYANITNALAPLPVNPLAASSQYVTVPSAYNSVGNTTNVGSTVTFTSSTPIFFDTSATINVFGCTNTTFNATAPTIVSITGNIVVMTYASAPTGPPNIDCAINSSEVILNGAYGTSFDVLAPTYQSYTSMIFNNIVTGLNYTVTLSGNNTYSNVWPAAFIPNAPALPASSGVSVTFGAILTSPTAALFVYPWRLTPTASFSGAIAAGACITNSASVVSAMSSLGYKLGTTNTYEVSFYPYPGDAFHGKINYQNTSTANVRLCNTAATSQTPTTTVGYATVQ